MNRQHETIGTNNWMNEIFVASEEGGFGIVQAPTRYIIGMYVVPIDPIGR